MQLGMLSTEMRRPTARELFRDVAASGMGAMQLSLASITPEEMPGGFAPGQLGEVAGLSREYGVEISAINGTFNMIHPDPAVREEGLRRFAVVARATRALGCPLLTLCTGTRNTESMWRWDDGNLEPSAWTDLLHTMEGVLEIAEREDLLLGIETEASNVVNSPERARRLMDEMGSPRLKIIMDVANLFQRGEAHPANVRPIIDRAFSLLGGDIQIAHGKDIMEGDGLQFTHAGHGIVDFPYFREKLEAVGYHGAMLLHGIKDERYWDECLAYARGVFAD